MKLSVSAYRAHAAAHKKILSTVQHHHQPYGSTTTTVLPSTSNKYPALVVDGSGLMHKFTESCSDNEDEEEEDDCTTPLAVPEAEPKRPIETNRSNQRWMKLRTTVQISSAIQKVLSSAQCSSSTTTVNHKADVVPQDGFVRLYLFQKPQLKREDSFLQRFSGRTHHLVPSQDHLLSKNDTNNGTSTSKTKLDEKPYYVETTNRKHYVLNPDENLYFHWLGVVTICVLYNLWTLIVRQSFPELQVVGTTFWVVLDRFSDLVFVLDVFVQFRTGHLEQGLMVYDGRKLALHYIRSRAFILDCIGLCPLDLLQYHYGTQPLLRWPRFLKVYRAVNYYYMVESRTIWPNLWRVLNLIHILLILAHWFGCFYYLLSESEGFRGEWVYPYRPGDYATLTRKYLGSIYWSTLTLTTIGDLPTPETNVEQTNSVDGPRSLPRRGIKSRLLQFTTNNGYIFTIVSYLIGVFIFATIVGQVGNVITNRNANRLEFERLLDGAKTYMRHHKVPGGMKRRVLRWYDYSWSRGRIQGGGDINTALGLLPDKLKTELALHVNLSVLKKVTIFQECQPEFLRDLVLKMRAYIFTPGDAICRKGEVAREMFIIADGILEVLSENGRVLTTMKAGDFFGEIGILNLDGLNKRTADVRSVGYSELLSLSREDVLGAMQDYPEAQEILQALGRKRLMEVKASARQNTNPKPPKVPPPLGAGLPLLQRIKLLKEKEEAKKKEHWKKLQAATVNQRIVPRGSTTSKPYKSIEDLSPELNPLPFVKKMKILNERQKLIELEETVMKTHSTSNLDLSNAVVVVPPQRSNSSSNLSIANNSNSSTDESNETPERRTLRSILKRNSGTITNPYNFQDLIKAPTPEGYAARHSRFLKNVTFHQKTVLEEEVPNTSTVDAIKLVLNEHYEQICLRFDGLMSQIQLKDQIIEELQTKITLLEGGSSSETLKAVENGGVDSTVLDIESDDDTDTNTKTSTNWEIELLAKEIRRHKVRSASWDYHNNNNNDGKRWYRRLSGTDEKTNKQ